VQIIYLTCVAAGLLGAKLSELSRNFKDLFVMPLVMTLREGIVLSQIFFSTSISGFKYSLVDDDLLYQ